MRVAGGDGGGRDEAILTELQNLRRELQRTRAAVNALDLSVDLDDAQKDPY